MGADTRADRAPGERGWRVGALGALVVGLVPLVGSTLVGRAAAQDSIAQERHEEGPASMATTGVAERVALAEADVREGEADLVRQARAALDEAVARRRRGDEPGAVRAERIAEAALGLVAARRARADSSVALEAARGRRAELESRRSAARTSRESAARERERLGGAGVP